MYINLPITGIIQTTKFWLNKNNNKELVKQILYMLNTILKQNYFQYSHQIFQPKKGIAVGSPISSTMAEVYLQYIEETHMKQWLDSKEIIYYKRYVDDILIVYDQSKINEQIILHQINNIDKNLQFKLSTEENNIINYLDTSIHGNNTSLDIGVYRKPTATGTVIHITSNHPHEQKISVFNCYTNRMITVPATKKSRQEEWKTILAIAENNGYSTDMICNLKNKIICRKQKQNQQQDNKTILCKKLVAFTHLSPLIRCVTSLFKQTNLKAAFRAINTIQQQLSDKQIYNNPSGIHKLKCNTCNRAYVGQTGRAINIRYKEHTRCIRTNNSTSVHAAHILENRHEYSMTDDTLQLLKTCQKGSHMNCWEVLYIQAYHQQKVLIAEQQVSNTNSFFELANITSTSQRA